MDYNSCSCILNISENKRLICLNEFCLLKRSNTIQSSLISAGLSGRSHLDVAQHKAIFSCSRLDRVGG